MSPARDSSPRYGADMLPTGLIFAAAEGWAAVLGGLIPFGGLAALGYVLIRAARDDGD